jgi:hypothetical protein
VKAFDSQVFKLAYGSTFSTISKTYSRRKVKAAKNDPQKSLQVKTDIAKKKKNKKAILSISIAGLKTIISDDGLRRSPRVKAT